MNFQLFGLKNFQFPSVVVFIVSLGSMAIWIPLSHKLSSVGFYCCRSRFLIFHSHVLDENAAPYDEENSIKFLEWYIMEISSAEI
jgi:hypothetical protein